MGESDAGGRTKTDFPGGFVSRKSACNVGDLGSIPGWEDPLGEEMATHSSILAWRIPWTEEPGGLQSMGVTTSWTRLKCLTSFLNEAEEWVGQLL